MSFRLNQVNPVDIHSCWPLVKEGLFVVKKRADSDKWIPEDVYHHIKAGISFLYLGFEENEYAGFLVLTPKRDQYTNELFLHVWIAYSKNKNIYEYAEEQVKRIARDIGASCISFGSPRLGWKKRYKIKSVNYEVPL